MTDLSMAPTPVKDLAMWLVDRGSPLLAQSYDSPTNQLLRARLQRGVVQVLADRGQWFIELAPPDVDEYFNTTVWSACLKGAPVSLELTPLGAQVVWLKEFLDDDSSHNYSVECLREAQRTRAFGRMGLAP